MQGTPEPNGRRLPELCLAANYSQRFGAQGVAWGYMDAACTQQYIFMCRIMRGWHAGA
jgi:hypothetical protein